VFRGPYARRLTAEQFADAVSAITGEWGILRTPRPEPGSYERQWRFKSSPLTRALGRPIRDQVYTQRSTEATMLQALEVMNGATMSNLLHRGAMGMLGAAPKTPENLFDSGVIGSGTSSVPAVVDIDIDISHSKRLILLLEDADAYDPSRVIAGLANPELVGPSGATPLQGKRTSLQFKGRQAMDGIVMPLESRLVFEIGGKGFTRFRAVAGVDQSCMKSDISPRARLFIFDDEPNMQQLVRVIGDPPAPFVAWKRTPDELAAQLFEYALLRPPSAKEQEVARRFLSAPGGEVSRDGLEDLLWSMFLLPEFQYVQ
jgi:hypothetical protein